MSTQSNKIFLIAFVEVVKYRVILLSHHVALVYDLILDSCKILLEISHMQLVVNASYIAIYL